MVTKFRKKKKVFLSAGRQKREILVFSTILGLLVLLIIGFLVFTNLRISKRRADLTERIETLKNEIQLLQEKKEQLENQISNTSQEDYLEKEARERFNLKQPGEEVVTILPPEEKEKPRREEREWWNPFSW